MGASQSKTPIANEKLLIERLRALQLKDDAQDRDQADSDYVHLTEKDVARYSGSTHSRAPWTSLTTSDIAHWEHELLQDSKNRLALCALTSSSPREVLLSRATVIKDQQVFSVKIPFEGAPITNQRSSGRCWLFASTNVFRVALMKRHDLDKFELSQAYLFFYDKLEKANFYLEQIVDTAGEDLDTRLVQTLMSDPVSDGGQWDMVYNLVNKYGLLPQALYTDSFNAQNTGAINSLITTKLREDGLKLREMATSGVSEKGIIAAKEKMLREIHLILTLTLGPPPAPNDEFTWSYLDKNGAAHQMKTTPLAFAKELESPKSIRITNSTVHDMFSLINDPRNEYGTLLSVDRLGNIVGGHGIQYVNVSMDTLKGACIKMLQAGLPIFFGCDVGKYSNSKFGIMDTDLIDYELGFNVQLGMSKAQRLMTGESQMTHAMVLTAVHLDEQGKSVRWRVQNSWGEAAGSEGWFVMSDKWMDQFVYQAVVEPRFVDKSISDVLKTKPKVLPLWDPMGSLA
ncbi:putative Cysteine proteinase 1, mitochondrial [Venustampulla echinocandica]|uniref:Cysteine proteinase 1, mitochondrial n=1 Tax=Venustampulla echinocandica TaxID=2656787 RepID=A0A370U1K4_9HELO|nr:putative Cysteine proteinase 1, mitochondrial [Venustampulla echinocandica]RDL41654.1 putative Cysteine proteinase 1, mitochondrial [Venustampulla echinocandica]